jgi:sulfotransferase family protein
MSAERSSPPAPQQGRIPDFFIVGHHKSGTTALYEMLRRHPQIYMPDLKEPRFFASDLRALADRSPASRLPRTLDEYLALFAAARPDQRAGEASPSYLRSQTAAREIAEVQPAARCIAILREPASFVRSLHLQLVQEHVEQEKDLARAVSREDIVRNGRPVRRYSDHIRYVEQLRRFETAFPQEQLLVLIYDDFRRENRETVRRVLRFLEVDDAAPVQVIDANPTVSVRSMRLDRLVRSLYGEGGPLSRSAKAAVRALVPERVRREALQTLRRRVVYGQPHPPDERLMSELRDRYRPEVLALSEHLGRDLVALWGYDHVR